MESRLHASLRGDAGRDPLWIGGRAGGAMRPGHVDRAQYAASTWTLLDALVLTTST